MAFFCSFQQMKTKERLAPEKPAHKSEINTWGGGGRRGGLNSGAGLMCLEFIFIFFLGGGLFFILPSVPLGHNR